MFFIFFKLKRRATGGRGVHSVEVLGQVSNGAPWEWCAITSSNGAPLPRCAITSLKKTNFEFFFEKT